MLNRFFQTPKVRSTPASACPSKRAEGYVDTSDSISEPQSAWEQSSSEEAFAVMLEDITTTPSPSRERSYPASDARNNEAFAIMVEVLSPSPCTILRS